MGEAELKKQLSAGELYSLYLIAGEEKYLVKRAAGRVRKKAGGESLPEFNSQAFSGETPIDSIADAVEALPLFAEHKCVAVADLDVEALDQTEQKKLFELLENLPDTTTLVLWYPTLNFDGKKSAKWKKLLKLCTEKGGVLLCGRRSGPELQKLLVREGEKAGCVLSRQDAAKIIEYAGQDVTLLLNEMEKLCAYALGRAKEGDNPQITREIIEELVPKTTETTVFLMTNALTAGNYEKAYGLLDALLYQNQEPIAILGALASAYVDMARVKTAFESGLPSSAAAAYGDYKGKEFRLRNAEKAARSLPAKALGQSLSLLKEADMALKGSRLDGRIVLEELIAKLLLAAKGEAR